MGILSTYWSCWRKFTQNTERCLCICEPVHLYVAQTALWWFCPWLAVAFFGDVCEFWVTSKSPERVRTPQWLVLLVATSLRAQQITHTWCNRTLLITLRDPCKSPITPSNKHSQGGHEARGRLLREATPLWMHYWAGLWLFTRFSCPNCIRSVKKTDSRSVPLQRVWSNYHAEAQQTYPKVKWRSQQKWACTRDRMCLFVEKTSGKRQRGQRVKLCRASIHHWSFMIQKMGAASHNVDLSVACSHLCPDVHSADLLKEKNHSMAWKDWKSGGKNSCLLECFHLKVAVEERHLQESSSLRAKSSWKSFNVPKLLTRAGNTDRFSLKVILFSSILQRKRLFRRLRTVTLHPPKSCLFLLVWLSAQVLAFERHQVPHIAAAAFQQTKFEISASVSTS